MLSCKIVWCREQLPKYGASFPNAKLPNLVQLRRTKQTNLSYSDKIDNLSYSDKTDNLSYSDTTDNLSYSDKTDNLSYSDKTDKPLV